MSYNRKYYLHAMVKKMGFKLMLRKYAKTVSVRASQAELAKGNKYLTELSTKYQYGIQFVNTL